MRALPIHLLFLLLFAAGCGSREPDPMRPNPLVLAPVDAGALSTARANPEVARGEVAVSLIDETGTLVTYSTRNDPVTLVRPCIDNPKLAPRPLSPSWMLFSISIDYNATTVKLRESSTNDEPMQKLTVCVARALEHLSNAQGLSRGVDRLVAYVSIR